MNITQIPAYEINLQYLLEQYKRKDKLKAVCNMFHAQGDDLETALFEIRDDFYLDTAAGVQLDIIGYIFNETRGGDSDTDFRARIKAKAALLNSGEPESIIGILKGLYGATYVQYIPAYPAVPAMYYVYTDATITVSELEQFSPAGVGVGIADNIIDEAGDDLIDEEGNDIFHIS